MTERNREEEVNRRLDAIDATLKLHHAEILASQELFDPMSKAMVDMFLEMVLKTNPINEEEKAALELVRSDIEGAPAGALYLGLHAAERELLDGKLNDADRKSYVAVLLIMRAQLRKLGAYVETDEETVKRALDAADKAGRVPGEKE